MVGKMNQNFGGLSAFKMLRGVMVVLGTVVLLSHINVAEAGIRLKDIVDVEGIRDNPLVGYGLVIGLNGTGDQSSTIQQQTMRNMLNRLGVDVKGLTIDPKNVATVMVTASLPAFAGQGTKIDVSVGSIANAKSLGGGTLLVTPLVAANGEVYVVAQGPISISGFSATGKSEGSVTVGTPTSGRIPSGGIVEREIDFSLEELPIIRLSLRNPDFTTARRVSEAINTRLQSRLAKVVDPGTILVAVPENKRSSNVDLLTDIENIIIETDMRAKVIIDERTGAIVMGENVRISTVAVSLGTLSVKITETPQVSQPNSLTGNNNAAITSNSNSTGTNVNNAGGVSTVTVQRSDIQSDSSNERRLAIVPPGVSLSEVVQNLNALGIGPRDMITILQAIKAAGAMQAEISGM